MTSSKPSDGLSPQVSIFWTAYCHASGYVGLPHDVFPFGDDPSMADELLALVLNGQKQATATRLKVYELEGLAPPKAGDLSLVLGGAGQPACVIETVKVDLLPFEKVGAEFAYIEGEGDRSLDYWQRVHLTYYERECAREGSVFDPNELIVCEQFKLAWTGLA